MRQSAGVCAAGWILCLALTLFATACRQKAKSLVDRPNVILLVMDTTRADRCSVTGYDRRTTPRLEALAAEGVVYRNAWSPAGWTGPTHASLFTGLRPEHHRLLGGVHDYLQPCATLASLLRDSGYRTAAYSNNVLMSAEFGLDQGFTEFFPLFENTARPYPWAPETHRLASEWVKNARKSGKPFFLFINDMEPHFPYAPPREHQDEFLSKDTSQADLDWALSLTTRNFDGHNLGTFPISANILKILSQLYDGEIACLDHEIGHFVDNLRAQGVLDNTVMVVVADHGENFGEHGRVAHVASIHRTIRHVPLVIRYPKVFAAGTVVDATVRLEDLMPTLLEFCGVPVPAGLDGETLRDVKPGRIARAACGSITPVLRRMRREFPRPYDDSKLIADIRSVYDGRWDLIRYSDGREELFDVSVDPEERFNRVQLEPGVVFELQGLLPPFEPNTVRDKGK